MASSEFYFLGREGNSFWRLKHFSLLVRSLFALLVLTTMLAGFYFSIYHLLARHAATLTPTGLHSEAMLDHGRYLYFTVEQAHKLRLLNHYSFILTATTIFTTFWLCGMFHDIVLLVDKIRAGTFRA